MTERVLAVECIFATLVPDASLNAAVMYWGRGVDGYGPRLTLLDYSVGQLTPKFWNTAAERLKVLSAERRARRGSLGIYVESEVLSQHAEGLGYPTMPILEHLVKSEAWPGLVAVAMAHLREGELGMPSELTQRVRSGTASAPAQFLAYRGGERPKDDPTVAAFLYGIVLGLDFAASRPPRAAKVKVVA